MKATHFSFNTDNSMVNLYNIYQLYVKEVCLNDLEHEDIDGRQTNQSNKHLWNIVESVKKEKDFDSIKLYWMYFAYPW